MKYLADGYKTLGMQNPPYRGMTGRLLFSGMLMISGCSALRQRHISAVPETIVQAPAMTEEPTRPEDAFVSEIGEMAGVYRSDISCMGEGYLNSIQGIVDDFLARERQRHIEEVEKKTFEHKKIIGNALDKSTEEVRKILE